MTPSQYPQMEQCCWDFAATLGDLMDKRVEFECSACHARWRCGVYRGPYPPPSTKETNWFTAERLDDADRS